MADLTADLERLGPRLGLSTIETGGTIDTPPAPYIGLLTLDISEEDGGNTLMQTWAVVNNVTGHYSPCNFVVYRNAWQGEQVVGGRVSDRLHVLLTHEAVHCYQNTIIGNEPEALRMPAWIMEGSAAWLAGDDTRIEEPSLPSDWRGWFNPSDTRLVDRSYDAVGYYALLDHLGRNLWSLMGPAWHAAAVAPGNESTEFLGVLGGDDPDVQQALAPSLARRGDWGDPWEAHGFGLHADAQAHLYPMAAPAEPLEGDLAGRSARLGEVATADGEVVTVETSGLASAHDDAGNQVLGATEMTLCTVDSCVCPPGAARAGEDVAGQPMRLPFQLAIYAPRNGATYTVAGHHLDDLCGPAPSATPAPLHGIGGSGTGDSGGGRWW